MFGFILCWLTRITLKQEFSCWYSTLCFKRTYLTIYLNYVWSHIKNLQCFGDAKIAVAWVRYTEISVRERRFTRCDKNIHQNRTALHCINGLIFATVWRTCRKEVERFQLSCGYHVTFSCRKNNLVNILRFCCVSHVLVEASANRRCPYSFFLKNICNFCYIYTRRLKWNYSISCV